MALGTASFEDGNSITGKELRQFAAWQIDSGLSLTSAVFSGLKVSQQASPATTVRVALGRAGVAATESGKFGAYPVWNDASANSPAITATSTNGRKDFLIIRVTSGDPAFEIVQGTASASPAEPAIPGDNYIVLALITLPASTTNITDAMIADRRVFGGRWAQPWGLITSVTATTPQTSIGAIGDFSNPSALTWVAVANRKYKVSIQTGYIGITSPPGYAFLYICNTSNTKLQTLQATCRAASHDDAGSWYAEYIESPAAGSVTRKIRGECSSGVYSTQASSTQPTVFKVEDCGPAANPD